MNSASLPEKQDVHHLHLDEHENMDNRIRHAYARLREHPETRKTHLFHGRYENIYPPRTEFPEIEPLLEWILENGRNHLDHDSNELGIAFWFNEMQPGDKTTLHTHNDGDELLSGVYYLEVPEGSGDIIFHFTGETASFTPAAGDLFLFSPALPHEVGENRSHNVRLSVAFNIGIRRTDDA
ncbi:MAG: hypothetical protein P8Z33_08195 [Gammaproteobacteria bacterium]